MTMNETWTPDRVNSVYPILNIGGKIVWDLTEFGKASMDELLNNRVILQPIKKDDTFVTFCKCDFNVKILIYENATADDIIIGWAKINEELKLDRIVNLFLKDFLHNLPLTRYLHEEPNTILLLRLVYWYYKSGLISGSFSFKRDEIKKQLLKGLLDEREKIEKQMHAAENDAIQILVPQLESVILGFIKNPENLELKRKSKIYRDAWFKAVWNLTSELLFAGICAENNFKVTFAPPPPDFIVEGHPIQVKSLNTPYDNPTELAESKILRKELVDASQITFDSVIEMILDAIKIDEVDDALERGAKIVFLNGTSNKCAGYFGQLYLVEENPFSFRRSLTNSIHLVKVEYSFIPLIFCTTGIRLQYYINTLPFKVPIIDVNGQKSVDRTKEITIMK